MAQAGTGRSRSYPPAAAEANEQSPNSDTETAVSHMSSLPSLVQAIAPDWV